MHFDKYHKCLNIAKLDKCIKELARASSVTDDVSNNFNRYHPSLIQKLRAAQDNLDSLMSKLSSTDVTVAAAEIDEFSYEINTYVDGYFYNAGSAMDILARIVLTLFGRPLSGNIYFQTAHRDINLSHPSDAILPRLSTPPWRQEFTNYRNTSTHELILASKYYIDVDSTYGDTTTKIIFPLPDDPRATPDQRKYKNNPDVVDYASTNFQRILRLVHLIYGDIADRAKTTGALPL